MRRWGVRLLMLMAIGAGPVNAIAAPIVYDEAMSGDLTSSSLTAFTFDGGLNTISGTIHIFPPTDTDFDDFLFTLPAGTQLVGVTYAWRLEPQAGNEVAGASFSLRSEGGTGPVLAFEGVDLYAVAQPLNVFAPAVPLGPGTYLMDHFGGGLFPTGWTAHYTWTFEVEGTAVPEPGSLILMGSGLAALAVRRRRSVSP